MKWCPLAPSSLDLLRQLGQEVITRAATMHREDDDERLGLAEVGDHAFDFTLACDVNSIHAMDGGLMVTPEEKIERGLCELVDWAVLVADTLEGDRLRQEARPEVGPTGDLTDSLGYRVRSLPWVGPGAGDIEGLPGSDDERL